MGVKSVVSPASCTRKAAAAKQDGKECPMSFKKCMVCNRPGLPGIDMHQHRKRVIHSKGGNAEVQLYYTHILPKDCKVGVLA